MADIFEDIIVFTYIALLIFYNWKDLYTYFYR